MSQTNKNEIINIPLAEFKSKMEDLRKEGYDYLRSLTGMDWGEEGLGVVYHLEKTSTSENIVVKTLTQDRESPNIPTVSDIWKGADFNEREAFDYLGIQFVGHKDMRRLFLRDD